MTTTPTPTPGTVTTMRAITYEEFGSADVLGLTDIARPVPSENEVLVRVHAAGVERGAWHMMTGRPYLGRLAFGLRTPRNPVLGTEVAGTVDAVGSAVTRFAVGDAVYGFAAGSFAEYAVAREDRLAAKPSNLTFEQAAAVPVSGATALQALTDVGRLSQGQTVLVLGASGGVGSYTVQIAKALGAEVTGVASTHKLDLVRSLGADHVLDYTRDDFASSGRRYDLVVDIAGNPTLSRLRRALTPSGTAVITGGELGGPFSGGMNRQLRALALSPFLRQRLTMFIAKQRASDLERLSALIRTGQVTPSVERTYPLREAADALRHLESGDVRGKVVISIGASAAEQEPCHTSGNQDRP
ncbi:NAD(P)-dependent alcohol dehydrogenase [Actinopolymorpha pittospori]|uniref:NADPH:quinone reductase-like Zn-dependent oxidoreductase n=1 Tax=Actinopolymorpha pittospori TaxID=648752 RepID=A0A927MQX9_9ACTN|nr:NAD(P)-dependent alcohol dehydrogenase [Actinopolymorpha pittospori]MBE1603608.1 NADPH:quinone reductase-like Zn-dependent oxidoreductase [Actinopolymorpha pittospori]